MTFFDLILLLILLGFVWFGFWNGLIQTIGGIISVVLAVFIASRWYETIALKIMPFLSDNFNLARLLGFIAVFILARFVIFILFKILNKLFDILSFIPFLKTINRLAGAILGFVEGALIIGLVLYFSMKFPLGENWTELVSNSKVALPLIGFSKILLPLVPKALKQIQSLI
ncbi:MAG: CvpA family protein [Patescibacteria group bacterium]|jgi:uncharacterized membrane protein required for colicin V production|nr:CvpA family protein [Patescibacteria group bacterium]MDD5172534.1 CvpA family protein [Patescibacteria group bacterium]